MPFIHLHNVSSGLFKVCCNIKKPINDEFGKNYFVGNQPIDDVFNSNFMKKIRELMVNNKSVPLCIECYNIEDNNGKSLRQEYNQQYGEKYISFVNSAKENNFVIKDFPPFIELRTGSVCNSACRMCNSNESTLVYKENKHMLNELDNLSYSQKSKNVLKRLIGDPDSVIFGSVVFGLYQDNLNEIKIDVDEHLNEIITNIEKVDSMTLSGGEPLLLDKTADILAHIADKKPNIKLQINTNGSIASQKVLDALAKLNNVHLSVSIDGLEKVHEYIRYPLKWSKIEENIDKFYEIQERHVGKFFLSFNLTVQNLNIFNITDTIRFLLKKYPKHCLTNLNHLHYPDIYRINIVPNHIKNKVITDITNLIKELESSDIYKEQWHDWNIEHIIRSLKSLAKFMDEEEFNQELFTNFVSSLEIYDNFRKQSFKEVIPDWMLKP